MSSRKGVVQGVGYREFTRRWALRLDSSGWVRNRRDGSVEAMVAGSRAQVDAIVAWARRGPEPARVSEVEARPGEGVFTTFEQWPSA